MNNHISTFIDSKLKLYLKTDPIQIWNSSALVLGLSIVCYTLFLFLLNYKTILCKENENKYNQYKPCFVSCRGTIDAGADIVRL